MLNKKRTEGEWKTEIWLSAVQAKANSVEPGELERSGPERNPLASFRTTEIKEMTGMARRDWDSLDMEASSRTWRISLY
jgi:hypothetical protein